MQVVIKPPISWSFEYSTFFSLSYFCLCNMVFNMKNICYLFICLILSSCAGDSSYKRVENMQKLIKGSGFQESITSSDSFFIFNLNNNGRANVARIYIEGDGFSWKNSRVISKDPTPKNPTAMKLALEDKSPLVIYLARPCQYTIPYGYGAYCKKRVWSSDRFSRKALTSISQVIDKYKKKFDFDYIEVVGFSGGGTIAMLLPTVRNDVEKITTFAGNLDVDKWVKHHGVSPLTGSLNPADFYDELSDIPQVHYVGLQDTVVPPFITHEFAEQMRDVEVIEVDTNHYNWSDLEIK
jgi:hypothetical protein